MKVELRPDILNFLREKVERGQFESIEEAANELLGLAREEEELTDEDIEQLRREVQLGIDQADRGEFSPFTAEDIIRQEQARMRKNKAG